MNWGIIGIIIVFGAFLLLLIFNPNLSCFGKRLKSPFYPLYRKKKNSRAQKAGPIKTEDYGFHLTEEGVPPAATPQNPVRKKAEDTGLKLD